MKNDHSQNPNRIEVSQEAASFDMVYLVDGAPMSAEAFIEIIDDGTKRRTHELRNEDREDILQQVRLESITQHRVAWENKDEVRRWASRRAVSRKYDLFKSNGNRKGCEEKKAEMTDTSYFDGDILERDESSQILSEEIGKLGGNQPAALILCYKKELPHCEIAECLGLSTEAIKHLANRARNALKGNKRVQALMA